MAKLIVGQNDLATVNPNLAAEWHPSKNGSLLPSQTTAGSNKKVWWLGKCGHEWEREICERSKGHGCPVCSGRLLQPGINDFATINPKVAAEWHPTKNGDLTPADVAPNSNKKVWWFCPDCGYEWQSCIYVRNAHSRCPACIGKTLARGINDLQTMNPELSSEWNYDLNKDLKPNDIKAVSTQKVWWICSKCGYEWKESPNNRRRNGRGRCPACLNSVVLAGYNDLATANSRLAAEWHPIKNGSLLPSQVTAVTGKKAWWTCSRGHEWEATIASRNAGNNCPFCANKLVLTGFNDLATVNPVVAAEWHPTENGDLSPQLVLSGSGKKVWWLGKCGHEWEAKISDRALRGYACPLCRKSRPKSHEKFCRAISELNPNIEIIGTYEKSHKKISVRCKKCGYEWETKPNNLQQGRGCPRCAKAGTSRTEQFIFAFLEQVFGADRVKSRDRETIGLELDIVCLSHAWEPGSWVWHCSSSKQRRDRQKIEMCREAGINLHTIYDSCPSKMKETSVDGCLYYTFDLWEEPEHATLKSLCLGWARDIDPAVNLSVIDWNGIELRAAERSGALSHDQFVDKIRQLFGGTIEVVDRYVAMHTRIRVRCKTCGYAWNPKPYYLIQGHGCHKCAGLYQGTVVCLETGKEYKNYRQAALAVGLKGSAGIKDACQNPNHTSGGYHWKLR